jgi:hypothetical protein
MHCSNCGAGSSEVQAGFDRCFCLRCGRETDLHGNLLPADALFPTPVNTAHGGAQQGVRKVGNDTQQGTDNKVGDTDG